jgi:hypothetical protein
MRPCRDVPMLAVALALACTAAPVASGYRLLPGEHPSVATSVSPSHPSGAQQTAFVQHRSRAVGPATAVGDGVSSLTPRSLGLPGGTLNPSGARQPAVVHHGSGEAVSSTPYSLYVRGGPLVLMEAQRNELRKHQSGDPIGWLIGIGAVGLVVIGTGLATRRQGVEKQEPTQTVQPA